MEIKSIDKETFLELYDRYADRVYQIALYYTGSEAVAEDITQEVFADLYAKRENLNVRHFEAWIKVSAKNHALNYLRDNTNRTDTVEYIRPAKDVVNAYGCDYEFISKLIRQERAEFVHHMLAEVYKKKPRWHEALTLIFLEEKSYEEAAKSMGISVGALNVMLHRIRKWMRKRYQKKFDHLDSI